MLSPTALGLRTLVGAALALAWVVCVLPADSFSAYMID